MATVQELVVRLRADGDAQAAAAVNRVTGAVSGLGAASRNMQPALGGAASAVEGFASPLMSAAFAAQAFAGTVAAVGAGLMTFSGVRIAAEFQGYQVGFEGLLGSAEKAKKLIGELRGFAQQTQFNTGNLVETSRIMLAMGNSSDTLVTNMKAIADAVTMLGGGNEKFSRVAMSLGQLRLRPRASGDELRELSMAGVNYKALLEAQGLKQSFRGGDEQVWSRNGAELTGAQLADAILVGMRKQFGGSAVRMGARTLEGVWLNTIEAVSMMMEATGKLLLPVLAGAALQIQKVAQWFSNLNTSMVGIPGALIIFGLVARFFNVLRDTALGAVAWVRNLSAEIRELGASAQATTHALNGRQAAGAPYVGDVPQVIPRGTRAAAMFNWRSPRTWLPAARMAAGGLSRPTLGGAARATGRFLTGMPAAFIAQIAGNAIGGVWGDLLSNMGTGAMIGGLAGKSPWAAVAGAVAGAIYTGYQYKTGAYDPAKKEADKAAKDTADNTRKTNELLAGLGADAIGGGTRAGRVRTIVSQEIATARLTGYA